MVNKDEVYVSIDFDEYKKNKANVLSSQANLISSIKHLKNLSQLSQQEKNLKIRLQGLFSSVQGDFNALEDLIPTPTIPKSIRAPEIELTEEFEQQFQPSIAEKSEEPSLMDKELAEIQEKLKQLNA